MATLPRTKKYESSLTLQALFFSLCPPLPLSLSTITNHWFHTYHTQNTVQLENISKTDSSDFGSAWTFPSTFTSCTQIIHTYDHLHARKKKRIKHHRCYNNEHIQTVTMSQLFANIDKYDCFTGLVKELWTRQFSERVSSCYNLIICTRHQSLRTNCIPWNWRKEPAPIQPNGVQIDFRNP